ncbi:hypothetical protein L6452_14754 [Arctium lappa]|uniref:Uncharacterized protein n=1 Tax=Arctium lappa TaxID=4217 RepID=A0ACB9CLT8_ARCLA|nr:hypothetical protein L6452_14754 [Arctium lappa]
MCAIVLRTCLCSKALMYRSASSVDYSSGEEVDGDDDDDDVDYISPASPSSQSSRFSRASSFSKREKNSAHWILSIIVWLLLPARLMHGIPIYMYIILTRGLKVSTSTPGRLQASHVHASRKALDHVVQRSTDRRCRVIEDLQLGMEIFIETIFDGIHKVTSCFISPMDSLREFLRWSSPGFSGDVHPDDSIAYVATATLPEDNPIPTTRLHNSLNTDARTCQDVITELGAQGLSESGCTTKRFSIGYCFYNPIQAESRMGALCDPPTRATHHAVPKDSELSAEPREPISVSPNPSCKGTYAREDPIIK